MQRKSKMKVAIAINGWMSLFELYVEKSCKEGAYVHRFGKLVQE